MLFVLNDSSDIDIMIVIFLQCRENDPMKNFVSDCDIDIDFLLNTSGIVQSKSAYFIL
ncbi:hypothetical protein T4C_13914 [Trichinella pseudospiralis]|uniref:Uncharacterized protein n=1 Tax=Trichinella pseudospiralis TaxID=6337 RepID=A0A0V1GIZ0_TRIPS|nr:hypothetical protein T4C_13914 [Trichinella pseudospiralis]